MPAALTSPSLVSQELMVVFLMIPVPGFDGVFCPEVACSVVTAPAALEAGCACPPLQHATVRVRRVRGKADDHSFHAKRQGRILLAGDAALFPFHAVGQMAGQMLGRRFG